MPKINIIYIITGIIGIITIYLGLYGKQLLFIKDTRTAVITLTVIGFIMCSTGALEPFVSKNPTHVLTIIGYVLGIAALFIGLTQVFNWKIAFISNPKNALLIMSIIIVIKIIVARFSFLLNR